MSDHSPMISFRLEPSVLETLRQQAHEAGMEANAYIQAILRRHAADSGRMQAADRRRVMLNDQIQQQAIATARALFADGLFDQHFVLTVIRALLARPGFRALYEEAIGGDAYATGLPGKSPLNMYLGWYIKSAIGAEPLLDARGKSRRIHIRGEAVQSYTLLAPPSPEATEAARRVHP